MAAEKLDLDDLDDEDLKALAEVKKKGYYHGRPKNETEPAAQRVPERIDAAMPAVDYTGKRTDVDAFQKKWDKFDAENTEADVVDGSSASRINSGPSASSAVVADETVVSQLIEMGFGPEESRMAAIATKNNVNAAANYIFSRGSQGSSRSARQVQADPDKLAMLLEMGFAEKYAREALCDCNNDVDRAAQEAAARAERASTVMLQQARDALTRLEADVAQSENEHRGKTEPPDPKRMKMLEEALTQASCRLDGVNVDGDATCRAERRVELDRCNALDARIAKLRAKQEPCDADSSTDNPADSGPSREAGHNPKDGARNPVINANSNAPSAAQERISEAEKLRLLGNTAFKAEDYESALRHYRSALELDSENVAILSNLAAAAMKLGEFEEALRASTTANDVAGGFSAKALFRKGEALEGLGRCPEACDAYRAALEVEPRNKSIRDRLCACQKPA